LRVATRFAGVTKAGVGCEYPEEEEEEKKGKTKRESNP
jgi:hypothetical protein